jgi:antitoxin ParD1/3/4
MLQRGLAMQIALDPATERLIDEQLKSGRFATREAVIVAGLQALAQLDTEDAALADLRQKVAVGIEAADRGDLSDGDEFFAELEREEQERSAQGRKTA